ncbi:tryptophan synthase subunit alpha [Streptomyces sp. NPDC047009]|uniref:tryptophan synthase subunit alpha n=1 Tax=Streptomyces sp. NPDC047009 TaxID=3154496 RepID=UPI0033CD9C38
MELRTVHARLARICAAAGGMLYAPAVAGVTGTTGALHQALPDFVNRLRAATSLPIGLGIGISNAEQAREASHIGDVVIVGSALIRAIEAAPTPQRQPESAALFAHELAAALRRPTSLAGAA